MRGWGVICQIFGRKKYPAQSEPLHINSIHNTLTLTHRGVKTERLTLVMAAMGILCPIVYGMGFCTEGGTFGRHRCDVCIIGEGRKEGRKVGGREGLIK